MTLLIIIDRDFRSTIQCSSICILTPQCSAFHFDEESKVCELGSSLKLVKSQSFSSQDVPVYSYGSGHKQFKTNAEKAAYCDHG